MFYVSYMFYILLISYLQPVVPQQHVDTINTNTSSTSIINSSGGGGGCMAGLRTTSGE
jgi:hypothetical protein